MVRSTRSIPIYRNAFVIYNPRAGKLIGGGNSLLERILESLRRGGHTVTPAATTGPQTAGGIAARCLAGGADLILAAGGDGTVNEVIQGMAGSHVPLGVLPAGTANVLGHELGLNSHADRVAAQVGRMVSRRVALGLLEAQVRRWFLLMAGIGLDAQVVYNLKLDWKDRLGKAAYWMAGARLTASRLPGFEVEVDGRRLHSGFTLVSRVRNYGGDFRIAPTATLLDDTFEVVLFRERHSASYLKYLAGMMANRLARMRGVTVLRARRLRLEPCGGDTVHVQVDGELAARLPASIELAPGALSLLMPPGYPVE